MYSFVVVGLWLAVVVGYIANIIQLIAAISNPVSMLLILKIVGIFAAPLGILLGYIGMF